MRSYRDKDGNGSQVPRARRNGSRSLRGSIAHAGKGRKFRKGIRIYKSLRQLPGTGSRFRCGFNLHRDTAFGTLRCRSALHKRWQERFGREGVLRKRLAGIRSHRTCKRKERVPMRSHVDALLAGSKDPQGLDCRWPDWQGGIRRGRFLHAAFAYRTPAQPGSRRRRFIGFGYLQLDFCGFVPDRSANRR